MTRDEFLIKIGIEPDNTQNQKAIEEVLDRVRRELNKEFKLNISEGNIDEIISQLTTLGSGVRLIKNEASDLTSVSMNFKSVNGSVVTLNSDIQTLIRSVQDFKAAGGSLNDLGGAIREGRVLDASGAPVSWNNRGSADKIIDSVDVSTTVVNKTNPQYVLDEIIKRYNIIQGIQRRMSSSNWKVLADDIQKARLELDEYIENNRSLISPKELSATQNRNEASISASAYDKILSIQNQIRDVKIKELTADKTSLVLLDDKKRALQQQLNELQRISKLSDVQKTGMQENERTGNLQFFNVRETQRQAQLERELNDNLKQQLSIIKQLNSSNESSNRGFIELQQKKLSELQLEHKHLTNIIDDKKAINAAEAEFNAKRQEIETKKSDIDDVKKIEEAIAAKKRLAQAEIDLLRLQKDKGTQPAIRESKEQVNELTNALHKATSAELSNGKAVRDSERYQKQANQVDEDAISIQRRLDSRYKTSTISLSKMGESVKKVAVNVLQYNLAWGALNQVDRLVAASVVKIKELDSSMTDIQLVTGQTNEQVHKVVNSYADLAFQLGATTKQVADGSVEWLRQGKTIEETGVLLKASTMLSKVGMIEASESTELMTAALNGFKLGAEDAIGIVDKLSAVDLQYATSAKEIATALQYVSSSAGMANISLDKMIALITIVSQTTRLGAEQVGQSFKTIIARMQNIKLGKFIDDETGESLLNRSIAA